MVNRPKNIGTAVETAIVRAARTRGFPHADRLTLTGAHDRGDIGLCPGVIIEAKGGEQAKNASDGQIAAWLHETEQECKNAHADVAFLVTQRPGIGAPNAHRWWAHWRLGWLDNLRDNKRDTTNPTIIRLTLNDSLQLIQNAGYGTPHDTTTPTDVRCAPHMQEVTQ
jgi:hypothetical protein